MGRWTGSWLGGPSSAGLEPARTHVRGQQWDLPADGPGAVAGTGRRLGQFVVDAAASALVAGLIVQPPRLWSTAVFGGSTVVFLALFGQTLGMRLLGLRVLRVRGDQVLPGRPGPWAAFIRTLLLLLLIPAVVYDRDGRGLHDRAVGTVAIRTR